MNYFFDTSALVKIYHQEEASKLVVDIYRSDAPTYISELSIIEYYSVVHRKIRENNFKESEVGKVLKKFENDLDRRFSLLCFNQDVTDNSKEVFHQIGKNLLVRSLDVIQLAFFKTYLSAEDEFMTFDARQELAFSKLKNSEFFSPVSK